MRSSVETETLTVSAYAAQIDRAVRSVGGAVVEGEVQKPQRSRRGLLYFDLTDGDSTLSCKVFSRQIARLGHQPAEGDLVRVTIERPDFWTAAGKLSLIVADVELAGEGELLRRRSALLEKLRGEGLCDPDRWKPLPAFPRAVGVIAGKDSEGMSDVIAALHDRFPATHIVTCPALVQGKSAPNEVIDALARLQQHPLVDVIVIARGGGMVRDLIAFDDERLCRAVFACATPVVAAIGHTNNVPVCNHVTHAAATPSRSAEMTVPSLTEIRAGLAAARQALDRLPGAVEQRAELVRALRDRLQGSRLLESRDRDIRALSQRIAQAETGFFATREQGLAERKRWLGDAIARQLADHERDYGHAVRRLVAEIGKAAVQRPEEERARLAQAGQLVRERVGLRHASAERDLAHVTALIEARDFRRQGFVLATDRAGRPVSSVAGIQVGTHLSLSFRDGEAEVAVEKTKESES